MWVTKYRYKVLEGDIAVRARDLIRQVCMTREIKILKGHVSRDHVHVMVSCPPKLSVSDMAQYIKGRSSHALQREFPSLRKRYWGQHLWARAYFCASSGTVTDEAGGGLVCAGGSFLVRMPGVAGWAVLAAWRAIGSSGIPPGACDVGEATFF